MLWELMLEIRNGLMLVLVLVLVFLGLMDVRLSVNLGLGLGLILKLRLIDDLSLGIIQIESVVVEIVHVGVGIGIHVHRIIGIHGDDCSGRRACHASLPFVLALFLPQPNHTRLGVQEYYLILVSML